MDAIEFDTAETPDAQNPATPTLFETYAAAHGEIEGWFGIEAAATWDALLGFQRDQKASGHLMEIGVWRGKSAALMALHADFGQESCLLVDKFVGHDDCRQAMARVGVEWGESIQFLQAESRALLADPLMQEGLGAFRWIHIDGEHTAGAVHTDLTIADRLLSAQGVVCIDDFFNWLYPQVTEGVLSYVRRHPEQFALFLCGYNKAYLARPHFVHRYLELCAGPMVEQLEQRGVEATLAKTTLPAEMNCFGVGPRFQGFQRRGPDNEPRKIRI